MKGDVYTVLKVKKNYAVIVPAAASSASQPSALSPHVTARVSASSADALPPASADALSPSTVDVLSPASTDVLPPSSADALPAASAFSASGKHGRLKVYTSIALERGQHVKIGLNTRRQTAFGVLSLAVPLLCALSGCLGAGYILCRINLPMSSTAIEQVKALCTVAFCLLSSALMAAIARRTPLSSRDESDTLQVIEVLD